MALHKREQALEQIRATVEFAGHLPACGPTTRQVAWWAFASALKAESGDSVNRPPRPGTQQYGPDVRWKQTCEMHVILCVLAVWFILKVFGAVTSCFGGERLVRASSTRIRGMGELISSAPPAVARERLVIELRRSILLTVTERTTSRRPHGIVRPSVIDVEHWFAIRLGPPKLPSLMP